MNILTCISIARNQRYAPIKYIVIEEAEYRGGHIVDCLMSPRSLNGVMHERAQTER